MRYASLALLLLGAWPAGAADDFRVLKLEQDVRNLERQVQELSRQVNDLRLQLTGSAGRPPRPVESTPAPPPTTAWLAGENWKRVRLKMSELDVIGILGPPTSTRVEDGARILFYATEIGSTGLLGGRVTLRDGQVAEITPPTLK